MESNYKNKKYILSFDVYKYFASGNYIKNSPDYKNVSQRVKDGLLQYVKKNKQNFKSLNYPLSQCNKTTSYGNLLKLRGDIIEKAKRYLYKQLKVLIEQEKKEQQQIEMNKHIYSKLFLSRMSGKTNSRFTDFFNKLTEGQKTLQTKNIKNEQTDSRCKEFFNGLLTK